MTCFVRNLLTMKQLSASVTAIDWRPIDPGTGAVGSVGDPSCNVRFQNRRDFAGGVRRLRLKVRSCHFAALPTEAGNASVSDEATPLVLEAYDFYSLCLVSSFLWSGPGETTEYLPNKPLIIYQQYLFHMQYSAEERVLLLSGLRGKDKSTE
jgi:hypothetical protein